ncbi:hypothetical protein TNCV_1352271 [Trichonephila clavipes]|nr:hypothetical protein TNCV_1352271 [Trichonephila clavipes]
MANAECEGGPRAPTPQRCSAGCSVYRQCVLEGDGIEIHDTGCRTSVAMRNATVQQPLNAVSSNSNPSIGMLQVEAGFASKHNIILFRCPCPPFIASLVAQTPVVSSQGMPGKIKLSLQEVLELLESLSSESSDSPTGDSSDEEVPANNLLEFSSDSDEEIEQDPGCSSVYSENIQHFLLQDALSKVISKDVDATVKDAVRTLVNGVYSDVFEQNGRSGWTLVVTGLPNRLIRTPTK